MKPTRPGWYWRRMGRSWQPVVVAMSTSYGGGGSVLVWQAIGSSYAFDVIGDGRWGERIVRGKARS